MASRNAIHPEAICRGGPRDLNPMVSRGWSKRSEEQIVPA